MKGRYVLEYSLVIGIVVGVLLTIQNYIKRSMQGQIKVTGEQMAEQYDYGFNQGYENFTTTSHVFEVTTLGWNHPTTCTSTKGSYSSDSFRSLKPLKARPPR